MQNHIISMRCLILSGGGRTNVLSATPSPATAIQSHAHKSVENNCGGKCIGLVGVTTSLACSFPGGKVRMGAFFYNYNFFIFSSLKIKEEKTKQKRRNFDCLRCSFEHRFKWMLRVNPHFAPR